MTANLLGVLNQLANLKQLNKGKLTEIIKESLYVAIAKKLNPEMSWKSF